MKWYLVNYCIECNIITKMCLRRQPLQQSGIIIFIEGTPGLCFH